MRLEVKMLRQDFETTSTGETWVHAAGGWPDLSLPKGNHLQ